MCVCVCVCVCVCACVCVCTVCVCADMLASMCVHMYWYVCGETSFACKLGLPSLMLDL